MLHLHPTSKRVAGGFVPMVTLRGDDGRMVGSKCPGPQAREYQTYTNPKAASFAALEVALRIQARLPTMVVVA